MVKHFWHSDEWTAVSAVIKHKNQCEKSFEADMIITFQHFLLAVSHNVDVLDADELEFDVGVVVFILVAFSGSSVCDCI